MRRLLLLGIVAIPCLALFSACAGFDMKKGNQSARTAYEGLSGKSELQPYLFCGVGDGLEAVDLRGRRFTEAPYRTIFIDGKPDSVSVLEGYRVMYAYTDVDYFFANVKVEVSDPARYASDKAKLILQAQGPAKDTASSTLIQPTRVLGGMEVHGIDRQRIDEGGVISTYTLFDDKGKTVTTFYFLNQGKKNRRFNDMASYQKLRDGFLERWTSCVASVNNAKSVR